MNDEPRVLALEGVIGAVRDGRQVLYVDEIRLLVKEIDAQRVIIRDRERQLRDADTLVGQYMEELEDAQQRIGQLWDYAEKTTEKLDERTEDWLELGEGYEDGLYKQYRLWKAVEREAEMTLAQYARIAELERLLRLFWKVAWSGVYIPLADRDEIESMILDAEGIANEKLGTMNWKNWHEGDYSIVVGEKIVQPQEGEDDE